MNRLKYILFFITVSGTLFSCDNDIDFPYEGKDRVYFEHYTTDELNDNRNYYTKIDHSLGLLDDAITSDTLRVVVNLMGKTSDVDREYRVTLNTDSTTAIAGKHYVAFKEIQTMKAGMMTDTLKVIIIRKDLSISYNNPEDKILYLTLLPTEDLELGLTSGLSMKVILNNYLVEPKWWMDNFGGSLRYYHPEKWKVLILFNKDFANYTTVPFRAGTQIGTTFVGQLEYYLNTTTPTFDKETGDRVLMNSLEPQK